MILQSFDEFDLKQTFDCGQCFRWDEQPDGAFLGVAGKRVIKAVQTGNTIDITCPDDVFINDYFDLKRDYTKIKNFIGKDTIINEALKSGGGIRILRQEPWETVVSFIISANNNIPRIKKIINSLCTLFGDEITFEGKLFYSFPSAERLASLTVADLSPIKSGFRDKYILDAAQKVASCEVVLDDIYGMSSAEGRRYLKQIKGVGDKVADCVLLFAYGKFDVFPKDVWIKKTLDNLYNVEEKDIDGFVSDKFGDYGGFAQQYLFYYARG